jgi:hypothetical protein
MSYLQNISALTSDNGGGVIELKVVRAADVLQIPTPVGDSVFGTITFKPGISGFNSWRATYNSAGMQARGQRTREGEKKENRLRILIPKDSPGIRQMLEQATEDEFIIIYTDGNGKQKLSGQLHAPMRFTFDHNTGSTAADGNFYEGTFFYEGPDNTFFYSGSAGTQPVGPANSIVNFNGSPLAVLSPGQTLNIVSDFGITSFFITS